MNKLLDEPQRSCLDILAKTKKLFFVLEVATCLLDGQARDLTAGIYAHIFKFLKHEYIYIWEGGIILFTPAFGFRIRVLQDNKSGYCHWNFG